jgi:hypothetical protein
MAQGHAHLLWERLQARMPLTGIDSIREQARSHSGCECLWPEIKSKSIREQARSHNGLCMWECLQARMLLALIDSIREQARSHSRSECL